MSAISLAKDHTHTQTHTPTPNANPSAPQVFYRCHILCFVGFFVFAHIHYSFVWMYFLPGAPARPPRHTAQHSTACVLCMLVPPLPPPLLRLAFSAPCWHACAASLCGHLTHLLALVGVQP